MNFETRLRKLESRLTPGRVVVITIEADEHAEPLEDLLQRYVDNGGVVRPSDLVVGVQRFT